MGREYHSPPTPGLGKKASIISYLYLGRAHDAETHTLLSVKGMTCHAVSVV